MSNVTYVLSDGTTRVVDAPVGTSLMKTAIAHDVPGIVGECGGSAVCATCHVYVESSSAVLPSPSDEEEEMLDFTAAPRETGSRLSCQISPQSDLDEIVVRVPEDQV